MNEDGAILVDGTQVASTKQCPHCGAHFNMHPGSGTRRAWCSRCTGVTCGKPECDACIPIDARFEHAAGRRTDYGAAIERLVQSGAHLL